MLKLYTIQALADDLMISTFTPGQEWRGRPHPRGHSCHGEGPSRSGPPPDPVPAAELCRVGLVFMAQRRPRGRPQLSEDGQWVGSDLDWQRCIEDQAHKAWER